MTQRYEFPQITNLGNVADPVNPQDASTKAYTDLKAAVSVYSGIPLTFNGNTIVLDTGFSGQTNTFNLRIPNAYEAGLVTYLTANPGPYYFATNPSTAWTVQSAVTSGGNFVTVTLTTAVTFPVAEPAGDRVNTNIATSTVINAISAGNNVTIPVNNIAGQNIAIINSSGAGGGTLQGLTDVSITEPTFTRVGTFTVDTIDVPNSQIIITQTGTGIQVGDYLNGTGVAGSATLKVTFVTTVGSNTNIQFGSSPFNYFTLGSGVFRLPINIDGDNLLWDNATNRWIASRPNFVLPFDITDWTNNNQLLYITNASIPIQTVAITSNPSSFTNPWTFGVASIPGFTSGSEVIGQDSSGKTVSGQYLDAAAAGGSFAVLQDVLPDRIAGGGFALNSSYTLYWRQGIYALANAVEFSGTTITQGQAAVAATADTEIANKIGYVVAATGLLDSQGSTTATSVIISGTQMSVFDASNNASALVTALTGQANPVQGQFYFPLTSAARVGLGNGGGSQSLNVQSYGFTGVAQSSVTVNFISGTTNAQIVAIFNNAPSNNIYVGPTNWGQFVFQTPPLAAIDKEIAANTVNSLDGIQGAVSLVAGTGIGISDSVGARQILITNTGSGTPGAGNTVDFTNDQFAETGITEAATESVYIQMGYTTSLEVGSGGTLNGTTYWDTSNAAPTGAGNGIRAKVATTWASLGIVFYTPAYQVVFTTPAGASANNYILDNLLFAKKTPTGNIYGNANLWPPFRDSGGASDDVQVIPVSRPTFSVASSGTNTWTATIGQGIWRASFGNYTWAAGDLTTEYVAYLRIAENSGATQPPTFVSATRTSGLGGIQILSSLPGTSGSTPTLQQVVNVGNQLSNASPNIATLSFLDTTVTPNQTRLISAAGGLEFNKLQLDGSTSGNIQILPAATTTNYTLTLPPAVGIANQVLTTDASGNTSWTTPNLTSYETGYVAQSVSGAVLTIRKLSGNANAADFTTGDGVWGDGLSTTAPFGSLKISVIGTPSGANLPLTIVGPAGATTNWNIGGGIRIVPKRADFNFPIYSTANDGVGLLLGTGLSLNASGGLQNSAIVQYNAPVPSATAFTANAVFNVGATSIVTAGNAQASFPIGGYVAFANTTGTYRYKVTNNVFDGTNTTLAISPALLATVNQGGTLYTDADNLQGAISSLLLGNNTTGTYTNGELRIDTSGSGGGGSIGLVLHTPAATAFVTNTITADQSTTVSIVGSTTLAVGNLIQFVASANAPFYQISAINAAAGNTSVQVSTPIAGPIAAGTTIYTTSAGAPQTFTSLSPGTNFTSQIVNNNLQLGLVTNPSFAQATLSSQPVNATDIVRLQDLQASQAGFKPQTPAKVVATTSVGTTYTNNTGVGTAVLSGTNATGTTLVIDGITLTVNDRILLTNQSALGAVAAGVSNGAYTLTTNVSGGAWTMTRVAVAPAYGNTFYVSGGTVGINQVWANTTLGTITVGTTPLTYAQFSQVQASGGTQTLNQTLGFGKSATTANSNITLFSDATNPLVFGLSAGNISLTQGSSGIVLKGSTGAIALGTAVTAATFASDGSGIASKLTLVGVSGNGSLAIASDTATLATLTFPSELQLVGQKVTACNGLANYWQLGGAVAGSTPTLGVLGSDTNVGLSIVTKGSGVATIGNPSNCTLTITGHLGNALSLSSSSVSSTTCGLQLQGQGTGALILGNTASFSGYTITGGQSSLTTLVATGAGTTIDAFLHSKGSSSGVYFGNDSNNTKLKVSISADAAGTQAAFIGGYNPTGTTNVDLVLTTQGAGWVYLLRDSLTGITGTNQPKLGMPTSAGATVMGPGTAGQAIVSNANTGSPYWGTPFPGLGMSAYSIATTSVGGVFNPTLVQQFNGLGLTLATTQLTGWVAGATYKIEITLATTQSTGTSNIYVCYWALQAGTTITTSVSPGGGACATSNKQNTAIPNQDFLAQTAQGTWTPAASSTVLSSNGFATGGANVQIGANSFVFITRLS